MRVLLLNVSPKRKENPLSRPTHEGRREGNIVRPTERNTINREDESIEDESIGLPTREMFIRQTYQVTISWTYVFKSLISLAKD